jgi:hypothetical protein
MSPGQDTTPRIYQKREPMATSQVVPGAHPPCTYRAGGNSSSHEGRSHAGVAFTGTVRGASASGRGAFGYLMYTTLEVRTSSPDSTLAK